MKNPLVHDEESPQQKAIRLLNRQLGHLQIVRVLNDDDPEFTARRDTTKEILQRFLGKESPNNYGFPVVPFPGEKFCPMAVNKEGEVCSEPTVDLKDGFRVCIHHLATFDGGRWRNVIRANSESATRYASAA